MASGTALTGKSSIKIDIDYKSNLATKLKETLDALSIDTSIKWTYGTGAKQGNVLFHEKLTRLKGDVNLFDLIELGSTRRVSK